jgi:tRNA threonylcarbamoyladenosine biosynthesis protein TsaB
VKILALETTDLSGSVAASDDSNLLQELELNPKQRSAQSLAPAICSLLEQVGWKPAEVQLVAVTVGPGSFTGLRVGVTTAKIFAYAVGADILGIDTLETIAANFSSDVGASSCPDSDSLQVILDAQRGEIVVGDFARSPDGWFRPVGPQRLLQIESWIKEGKQSAVVGPILKKLQSKLPADIMILEERYWTPRAAQVARLAARDYAAGRRDDLWTLLPRYSRRSAAEEKLDKA